MRVIEVISRDGTNSGKTAAACGLIRYLRAAGYSVAAFKPLSGSAINPANILQDGFNGNDATALVAELREQAPKTLIAPFEVIWPLAGPTAPGVSSGMIRRLGRALLRGRIIRRLGRALLRERTVGPGFLLLRLTRWDEDGRNVAIWNRRLPLEKILGQRFQAIRQGMDDEYFVTSTEQAISLMKRFCPGALQNAFEKLTVARPDFLVVESRGEVAHSWSGIREVDYVLLLGRGELRVYDGQEFLCAARKLASAPAAFKLRLTLRSTSKFMYMRDREFALRIPYPRLVAKLKPLSVVPVPRFEGDVVQGFAETVGIALAAIISTNATDHVQSTLEV